MDFLLENNLPVVNFQFQCKKHKQKLLIHALLKCSKLSLEGIASILKIPSNVLLNVYNGYQYLKPKKNVQLMELFLIFFTD